MKPLATIAAALIALAPVCAHAQEAAPLVKIEPRLMRPSGSVRILPPLEYDKPYTGKLIIERAETPEDIKRICNLDKTALACAIRAEGSCRIVIVPRALIEAAGYTEDVVMRHENSHCVGWPKTHPNSRLWPEATASK